MLHRACSLEEIVKQARYLIHLSTQPRQTHTATARNNPCHSTLSKAKLADVRCMYRSAEEDRNRPTSHRNLKSNQNRTAVSPFSSLRNFPNRMIPDSLARRSTVLRAETSKKAQRPVRGEDLPCIDPAVGKSKSLCLRGRHEGARHVCKVGHWLKTFQGWVVERDRNGSMWICGFHSDLLWRCVFVCLRAVCCVL